MLRRQRNAILPPQMRIPIVIFAQVPPPEHGQSRMVALALETLRAKPETFEVYHVNARFSESLEDIGESSLRKGILIIGYLARAIRLRFHTTDPLLYYVPGPVKWSSVIRDWILLAVLKLFYQKTVFHWHAIGHGEWAHGSERLKLEGPAWMDRLARKVSAQVLDRPLASIAVSTTSKKDSMAIQSRKALTVCNGIEDPCPDYETGLGPARVATHRELAGSASPCFRILFISHGTVEKGLFDAVEALRLLVNNSDPQWRFAVTFAGGVSEIVADRFEREIENLTQSESRRLIVDVKGYVSGEEKQRCYMEHDILLAPSRWESFGLTVLEAMAYGMQVVAAASDGVKGVLPEGHAYLAPAANPEALSARLLDCCTDLRTAPRVEEGKALRQRFLDLYQIKYFAGNLTEALRKLVAGDALPPPYRMGEQRSGIGDRGLEIGDHESVAVLGPLDSSSAGQQSSILNPQSSIAFSSTPHAEKEKSADRAGSALPSSAPSPIRVHPRSSAVESSSDLRPSTSRPSDSPPIHLTAYLADQNPGHDRSFGISRMSQVILEALQAGGRVDIKTITSRTSQQAPAGVESTRILPWGTRGKWLRLFTDHFHPLFIQSDADSGVHYFPKGYLPLFSGFCRPSVVTIHDTIIQYDQDHYPEWRKPSEYRYWAMMLRHTLRKADRILTVSESSKRQIEEFMARHGIPRNGITVTYEPCLYERIPQPVAPTKENYVIHLASCEPHKRSAHLIRWWHEAEAQGRNLPMLHLIGSVPPEVESLLASSHSIVKSPFLEEAALQAAYRTARALILPSEIEGFGLPALEAYYLGTPVCFVKGTSVEEILGVATHKGGFSLDDEQSLFAALNDVMAMSPEEVRECGLNLRKTYAAEIVAKRMVAVFDTVKNCQC
jgi:glycosyltransferase involved in cell wall biosynthesis